MPEFGAIARGLLTLEIDTIVSDGITAERMPTDGRALIRIAQLYKDFLARVMAEVAEAGGSVDALPTVRTRDDGVIAFADWTVVSGGLRTFGALRGAARACQSARAAVLRPNGMREEHDAILARVASGCADIEATLRRLGLGETPIDAAHVEVAEEEGRAWPEFDHDTLLVLRRIWETGVDVIVMQTAVHLDGSVITRVLDGWDGPAAAPLHDLHYRAVDISLGRWNLLVQTARDLAGFFFGGPGGGGPSLGSPSAAGLVPVASGGPGAAPGAASAGAPAPA